MTMDTAQKTKDTPPTKVDETPLGKVASPEGKEPSPKTSQPFTDEQQKRVDKLIQLASMKAGRDRKTIETERDTLNSQIMGLKTQIEDFQSERESLQKQIDDLASGDPDKFTLVKRDKELRDREKKLQDSLNAHETDKKSYAKLLSDAKQHEILTHIYRISEEFEGGDAEKLKNLCEKYELETEEEIKSMAETLWNKKEPETPTLEVDSGKTSGGKGETTEQERLKGRYPSMFKK